MTNHPAVQAIIDGDMKPPPCQTHSRAGTRPRHPDAPTHVRIDSAYLVRSDPALVVSSAHPVEDYRPPWTFSEAKYLVNGRWLSRFHVSPTSAPKTV